MIDGNIILFGWPVVMLVLFAKYDRATAIIASLLFGYLLLPENLFFDLPLIPALHKHSIPAIVALLFVLLAGKAHEGDVLPGWTPKATLPRFLTFVLIFSAFMTVLTNPEPLIYGPVYLPALRPYDAFAVILALLVSLIPFLLARKYLAYPHQQKLLLHVIVIAAAFYAFLALFEVRMSPQLNNIVYGFFPHSFDQHIRPGGFRPLVFLSHGLWLAIFFAISILAAFSLSRTSDAAGRMKYLIVGLWLLLTLAVSNSLGALAIALLLLPVVLFFGARTQMLLCAVFAFIVLLYPALRGAGWIPIEMILTWAEGISPERALSLDFRLTNEDLLLSHAQQQPIFGWGGFGRSMVFDQDGIELTITDGYWIIVVGQGGWARYLAEFGLLCLPAIVAAFTFRKSKYGLETTGLMLMLVANLIDLLPNSAITPITWLIVGSLWGRIELGRITDTAEQQKEMQPLRKDPVYTRFGGKPSHKDKGDITKPGPQYARRRPA